MFPIFVHHRGGGVRLRGIGSFFCLHCGQTREYERREWRSRAPWAPFLPPEIRWREFILCCTCDSTFDAECLNETSEAFLEEVSIEVPDRAIFTTLRTGRQIPNQRTAPSAVVEYESRDEESSEDPHRGPGEEIRINPRSSTLVAYSCARRH